MTNVTTPRTTWTGYCCTTDGGHHEHRATNPETPHGGTPCPDRDAHDWRTTRRERTSNRAETGEWERQQCRHCHSTRQTASTTWRTGATDWCATC